MRGSALGALA